MQKAVNPQTGEVLFLVDNQWVPPSQTAVNPQGQKAFLVGNEWIMDQAAAKPVVSQPDSAAPQQQEQPVAPVDETKTTNPLHGMFGRAAELMGSGAEAWQRMTAPLSKDLWEGTPEGLRSEFLKPQNVKKRQEDFTKSATEWSKNIGYAPSTKMSELGDNPAKVVPFVAERVLTSVPDMAAAATMYWPYVMARTDEILNERLKNDNKTYEQATVADVVASVTGAITEASLEKFASKRLMPGGKGITSLPLKGFAGAAGRVAKEIGLQGGTESLEELASYMGESMGTKKGFDPKEAGERMLEAGIVGAGLGGAARGGREAYDAGVRAKEEREREDRKRMVSELYAEEKAKLETPPEAPAVTTTEPPPPPPAGGRTIEPMIAPEGAATDLQTVLDEIIGTKPATQIQTTQAEPEAQVVKQPIEVKKDAGTIADVAIQEIPVDSLNLSKDVPQFKAEADERGIVEPLKSRKFDRVGTPPIQVWKRLDGTLEVISGRHRWDLARRTGETSIPAQVFDESKGFTADMAAIMDAELNIRDEKGRITDYVNYFKKTGELGATKDDYESRGLLDGTTGRRAYAVTVQGVDDLVHALNAGQIKDDQAYRIAAAVPNDARLQALGIKLVNEKPLEQAINILHAAKTIEPKAPEMGGDLFGFDDSGLKLAEDMGKLALEKQKALSADINTIERAGKQPAIAKKYGIDVKDPDAIKAKVKEMKAQRAAWDNWASDPTLVDQIRREISGEPVAEPVAEKPAEKKPAKADNYYNALLDAGFERLVEGDPRTYKNAAGEEYSTLYRDGASIGMTAGNLLFMHRGRVTNGWATGDEWTINGLIVEPSKRGKSVATKVMKDLVGLADKYEITLYLEPAAIQDKPVSTEKLADFYKKSGFAQKDKGSDKILVRKPGAKVEVKPAEKEVKAAEKKAPTKEQIKDLELKSARAAIKGEMDKSIQIEREIAKLKNEQKLRVKSTKMIRTEEGVKYFVTLDDGRTATIYRVKPDKFGEKAYWKIDTSEYKNIPNEEQASKIGWNKDMAISEVAEKLDELEEYRIKKEPAKAADSKKAEDVQDAILDALEEQSNNGKFDLFNVDVNKINGEKNNTWRQERISEYKSARQRMGAIMRRFAKGELGKFDEENYKSLYDYSQRLKQDIDITKPKRNAAADVLAKAAKELADGNISQEVFDVFDILYKKHPHLIDGLRLQVRAQNARSEEIGSAGQFLPAARIIRLFKETSGVTDPVTARHEITHSMEQMMDQDQRKILVGEWIKAVGKAMKADKTPEGQEYFRKVMDFLDRPSQVTMGAAMNAMPNYSYYQYLNPSEYWAVNAEPLMQARLGGPWLKFKQKIRALWDAIKNVFGASNFSVGNKIFNQIFNNERQTEMMISDYVGRVNSFNNFTNIKNYKGSKPILSSWGSPDMTFLDDFLYRIVNKHIDTKRVLEAISTTVDKLHDALNVYRRETLYHGRVTKRTEDFLKEELRPLVKEMVDNDISIDQFDEFLHNRHAEERNIQNNKVNTESDEELEARIEAEELDLENWKNEMLELRAEFGDNVEPHRPKPEVNRKKQVLRLQDQGSGIHTDDARAYLKDLQENKPELYKVLDDLAKKADAIVKGTQKVLVDGGIEEQSTIDNWNKTYKHYAPLQREDLDFVQTNIGAGQGQSARGGFGRRATGSTKKVGDIFANLAAQRERAIVRAEKAHVGRSLLALAIMNPNPSFWLAINPDAIKSKANLKAELKDLNVPIEDAENIAAMPKTAAIDPKTGLVYYKVDKYLLNSDNVFAVRVNGKDRFVIFNFSDPRAKRMCQALKNLDADQLGLALSIFSKVTRFVAQMNTQYNPVFGLWNFMRDYGGAMLNLSSTDLKGMQNEVGDIRNVFGAWRGIYKDLRGKENIDDNDWIKLWEEFQKYGGQTGFRQQFLRPEENVNIINEEIRKLTAGKPRQKLDATMKLFSDFNESMENAVRLSAYKVAVEKYTKEGMDADLAREKAAELAKNLTVNFNRKGQWSTYAGALYAFFNASVQGTARVIETLHGPKGAVIIKGGLAIGVVQAMLLALAGFGDDEPPEFVKEKNFVIPVFGTKKYISIPMPLGFNLIPNAGRLITEMIINGSIGNGSRVIDKGISLLTTTLDGFNPMGSGSIVQQATPTLFDPWSALYANKDAFGRPIYKEDRATSPTPGFLRSRESATEISKGISWLLNYISSPIGTKYTKGIISPTADEIDYVVGQYLGGAARETMKIGNWMRDKFKGEETAPYKIPVVGRLYGDAESKASISNQFYENVTNLAKMETEIKERAKRNESPYAYMRKHPETKMVDVANRLENQISQLNKTRKEYMAQNKMKDVKRLDEQKKRLMDNFNKQYDKIISK